MFLFIFAIKIVFLPYQTILRYALVDFNGYWSENVKLLVEIKTDRMNEMTFILKINWISVLVQRAFVEIEDFIACTPCSPSLFRSSVFCFLYLIH